MNFDDYVRQMGGLYLEFLESGRQNRSALEQAVTAAYQALENLPPALAAKLTPSQKREWDNLAGIYQELAGNPGWRLEDQNGWLEDARVLLRELHA